MQPVVQYASNAFVINFYLSLIIDLLNTPRAICFQKTVKVISRIIPWMTLINITAIFPQCLPSIMENFKREGFYSLRQVEGLLKKNQLLFHLQRLVRFWVWERLLPSSSTKACHINPTAFQAAVKLRFLAAVCVIHIPRAPRRGGNGFVMDTQ